MLQFEQTKDQSYLQLSFLIQQQPPLGIAVTWTIQTPASSQGGTQLQPMTMSMGI
jgi:hypothetical protein